MVKVHHFVEMWLGSQNQFATLMKSHASNMQMAAVCYILDM